VEHFTWHNKGQVVGGDGPEYIEFHPPVEKTNSGAIGKRIVKGRKPRVYNIDNDPNSAFHIIGTGLQIALGRQERNKNGSTVKLLARPREKWDPHGKKTEWFCDSNMGKNKTRDNFYEVLLHEGICEKPGKGEKMKYTIHCIRDMVVSQCAQDGVSKMMAGQVTGHAPDSATMDAIYNQPSTEQLQYLSAKLQNKEYELEQQKERATMNKENSNVIKGAQKARYPLRHNQHSLAQLHNGTLAQPTRAQVREVPQLHPDLDSDRERERDRESAREREWEREREREREWRAERGRMHQLEFQMQSMQFPTPHYAPAHYAPAHHAPAQYAPMHYAPPHAQQAQVVHNGPVFNFGGPVEVGAKDLVLGVLQGSTHAPQTEAFLDHRPALMMMNEIYEHPENGHPVAMEMEPEEIDTTGMKLKMEDFEPDSFFAE
jgi:hypothetical protein